MVDYFNPDSNAQVSSTSIEVNVDEVKSLYGFNDSQAEAFAALFRVRPLGLLQGPPGTGKTRFIGALIHYALTKGYVRNVLLSSQSHEAVNNAAEAVLKLYPALSEAPSIIRVGQELNVSERLLPFHVARVEQLYKDKFQATLKDRLIVAARAIGIPQEVSATLILLEITVRPVIEQINALAEDTERDGAIDRIDSLMKTLDTLNVDHELEIELPSMSALPDPKLLEEVFDKAAKRSNCSLDLVARFRSVARLTRDIIGSVSTAERSFETFLAGTRQIVAGTCVGLGRSSLGLTSTVFDLVVIDEAARSTASELAVPMQAGSWVVLVGDQEQLEPRFKEEVVSTVVDETGFAANEIVKSDFERVFESPIGKEIGRRITTQYRMLPPIGRMVSNTFYNGELDSGRVVSEHSPEVFPDSLKHTLTWVYTDDLKEKGYQKSEVGKSRKSLTNPKELEVIMGMISEWDKSPEFIQWLEARNDLDYAIGVICTYGAQATALKQKLRVASVSNVMRQAIKIDTVDSYQGKENLIVILSLVRNNSDGRIVDGKPTIRSGFMKRPNRINVATSRAMDRLVIVGAKHGWAADEPMAELAKNFDAEVAAGNAVIREASDLLEGQRAAQEASAPSSKAQRDSKVRL
ncbi:DEAD/DEAH box helicase [Halopseudomonas pelagia]|uniref:DEAD/DEAH box helicase n=1 Tax=Halopseudomonas pelagia TaxID=553151 RepID=UPI0015CA771D|nr:AAA domain-containing protein [Halopseudomonas pelagia]